MIVHAAGDLLGEQAHEFLGRGAGAYAEPHAVLDMGKRGPRRLDLQRLRIHRLLAALSA